ncbi:Ribonuclease H-like domain [Trinorchestia longiramus]|nr:Ribonuclease H-like domain [Trinorchestia longiramus]
MHHPYVVDTSVLFNLSGSKQTSKLKTLTSHFLHREIQCCSRLGHDPSEDAVATLQLALLKLQHDMTFGNVLLASGGMKTLPEHDLFYNMFEVRQRPSSTSIEVVA